MIDLMPDEMDDHLGWAPMGRVDMNWSVVLGPNNEGRIDYNKFRPMNWASQKSAPQPIEKFKFRFDPKTLEGRFTPIMLEQWR